ncbi:hypothetical protein [Eubacterium xylanophilum]|uniref:hypothetical protein n=1 Tax=Eubacterium xylanophilum TaxID=39497 RepID=UPI00047D7DA9|nr:hypothetical protein [Eubacterium xylanophilum]
MINTENSILLEPDVITKNKKTIRKIKRRLKSAPPGKLKISRCKNSLQYYHRETPSSTTGTYISKSNSSLLKKLVQKSYDKDVLVLLQKKQELLELFKEYSSCNDAIKNLHTSFPGELQQYIELAETSDEDYINWWMNLPWEDYNSYHNDTDFYTDNNEHVRSKTEINIANLLKKNGIPYKYEYPFHLSDGKTIYPDFTVLNIRERRVIIWEHRGMMDDSFYANHAISRFRDYENEGLYQGRDFIVTEETSEHSLGTKHIQLIINRFFS